MPDFPAAAYPDAAPRYDFHVQAEVTELDSGARLAARTYDISATGCYLDMLNPFPGGTRVHLRLEHGGEAFEARGVVPYAQPNMGMAVRFEEVGDADRQVLEKWLAGLAAGAAS
jgi:hypothetical protein